MNIFGLAFLLFISKLSEGRGYWQNLMSDLISLVVVVAVVVVSDVVVVVVVVVAAVVVLLFVW